MKKNFFILFVIIFSGCDEYDLEKLYSDNIENHSKPVNNTDEDVISISSNNSFKKINDLNNEYYIKQIDINEKKAIQKDREKSLFMKKYFSNINDKNMKVPKPKLRLPINNFNNSIIEGNHFE